MNKFLFNIVKSIRLSILQRKGWVFSRNVVISVHGVKKIGRGKVYCAENVCINAETMLVAFADIHIRKE